ncbi:MAG TPA: hypothetical protein VFZ02_03585 [Ktedonobacteraceae bacterium]
MPTKRLARLVHSRGRWLVLALGWGGRPAVGSGCGGNRLSIAFASRIF